MKFIADLHIHSHYSLATSKQCDLPGLWAWGQRKGITVISTGDFTHPEWFKTLKKQLEPAEPGLFRLKDRYRNEAQVDVPKSCRSAVRFMLSVEISSIYKKAGKTRKVHNLIYAPNFESAGKIRNRLDAIGNINSDGRPILGLDSKDVLKISLESGPDTFLIPAHIWTPWFSLFGSKSGFDVIEECYEELADEIFALETGLSSDPAMNWRLSALDRFSLVSNSDAHSPAKLGRNANRFDCDLSYFALRDALKTAEGFAGTLDLHPEEGKYHLDGHRKCDVVMEPEETEAADGLCPVCNKPLTVGVLNRIHALADRKKAKKPERSPGFTYIVPLDEILAEVVGQNPGTKKVQALYEKTIDTLGPELPILLDVAPSEIGKNVGDRSAEAIRRLRSGKLEVDPGFDGRYGSIRIFPKDA